MAGIDKSESILLIEHAISAFKHQDKGQTDLAKFLGIEATRLSEGKKGNWRLMPTQKELIVSEFGYPRQGAGVYVSAEHYSNIGQFIESFHDIGDKRFYQRLSSSLRNSDYLRKILNKLWLKDTQNNKDEAKLAALNKFIFSDDFSTWFNKTENSNVDASLNIFSLESWEKAGFVPISKDYNSQYKYYSEVVSSYLYRVGLLKFRSDSSYVIGGEVNGNIVTEELVLSGSAVLDTEIPIQNNKRLNSTILIPQKYKKAPEAPHAYEMLPDDWDKVDLKLFLSESMRYHVLITCFESEISMAYFTNIRQIVIEDLDQVELFQQIEVLRKFFGNSYSFEDSIKHRIAANGGYVPGARRL